MSSSPLKRALNGLRRSPLSRRGRRAKREERALEAFRRDVLRNAGYACEVCHRQEVPLHAHHILPRSR